MEKRTIIIIVSVVSGVVVAAGLGVLIWWLVSGAEDVAPLEVTTTVFPDATTSISSIPDTYTTTSDPTTTVDPTTTEKPNDDVSTIKLEGDGIGSARYTAAFARIPAVGDMFWWFYPTTADEPTTKPLLLWLDGVTGLPPSLLANFGMIGPYDFNFNERNDSWIDEYNLLFVDAPFGTGFSIPEDDSKIPNTLDENAEHLALSLNSFYDTHEEYSNTPLFIFGQGSGAQLAIALAARLSNVSFAHDLRGVVLGNAVISPALVLTKLSFYLYELGYIDEVGREAIENLSAETTSLVNQARYGEAFDKFLSLGEFVNDAGAVAVNIGNIVEKLTRTPARRTRGHEGAGDTEETSLHVQEMHKQQKKRYIRIVTEGVPDYFGQWQYLRNTFPQDIVSFMDEYVAPALGMSVDVPYDGGRLEAVQAVRHTFMIPAIDKVEHILENTNLTVTIYNGNLDAVSNTPGQLEWVDRLQWDGQEAFRNSPRQTLVVDRVIEGYYRETSRLHFYWINAAGQWVPSDSHVAMRRVLQRITNT